jgi:hypothetical protein
MADDSAAVAYVVEGYHSALASAQALPKPLIIRVLIIIRGSRSHSPKKWIKQATQRLDSFVASR